ncbi:MAG: hypothetical protein AAB474_01180 [Patescibacteria group bacterium]
MFFEIKLYMSVALGFYLLAFFSAKTFRKTHIFLAVSGLFLDLYATYLMETIPADLTELVYLKSHFQFILEFHTAIAILAIAAFLVQMALGVCKKRKAHIFSAKFIFLPIWIAAYLSGLYLLSFF